MLDVVFRVASEEIAQADRFAGVDAHMVLLLPEAVAENVVVRRLARDVQIFKHLGDFLPALLAGLLVVALEILYSLAAIGIVEFAGKLDVDNRFVVDFAFGEEPVHHLAEAEHGVHRHRVFHAVDARAAEAIYSAFIGLAVGIGFEHRRVENAGEVLVIDIVTQSQIVFEPLLHSVVAGAVYRFDGALDGVGAAFLILPHSGREHCTQVGEKYRLAID